LVETVTNQAGNPAPVAFDAALRLEVEEVLYGEAALLDGWRSGEWREMFTEDSRYAAPATDLTEGDLEQDLVFIYDDIVRLRAGVAPLNSSYAHREYPWSRTRRFISNVRITEIDGNEIAAN
jgi:p-cumate 2,3-dioxygenase beta subunit